MPTPSRQYAFTLIELLVVVSIVALMLALLLPVLGSARASAQATLCLSNQKQTTAALLNYAGEHDGYLMHYAKRDAHGVRWWFGYERGGPGSGIGRPLDRSRGPLAAYLGQDIQEALACAAFPADDPGFVAKFERRSAHFGYNGGLVWPFPLGRTPRRLSEVGSTSEVFAFADALHQDSQADRFYEPHTVAYRRPGRVAGTAHFRHEQRANTAYLDGHAQALDLPDRETIWRTIADAPLANLDTTDGEGTRYGFKTWTRR
ncbi:MAG: type II secretion system protein [Phycisphaeraceae bacterium]